MNTNGVIEKHWLRVLTRFLADALIFCFAFVLAMVFRFGLEWVEAFSNYWPGVVLGAIVFSVSAYILGLYASREVHEGPLRRALAVIIALSVSVGLMLTVFYLAVTYRFGRGALLLGISIAFIFLMGVHQWRLRRMRAIRERVIMIVNSPFDEHEIQLNQKLWERHLTLVGVVHPSNYHPGGDHPVLGRMDNLLELVTRHAVVRVICSEECISSTDNYKLFCQLRYSGVTVVPLIALCEEVYQFVPTDLVTTAWLLNASGSPRISYIKKMKRGFDIAASLAILVLSLPLHVMGILLVKFTSSGPVFYKQKRSGRFGQTFEILKLRTMSVDAEKHGAVWAKENDTRVTIAGAFLRKYRIDELPQLINILKGEMSLVGPRPERPEFVEQLSQRIPYYRERLMVQPGLTGWAQVNYPYGASIEDTRKKLEYDLYYLKHMSIFLDAFILLDTVRTVLIGGLGQSAKSAAPEYSTSRGTMGRAEVIEAATAVPPTTSH